ncbi:GATA zinc finger domain-containing protein [Mycena indigotica]|uniref:GATA zinc finger domain-containing protein n=1 Tax=Mycena indigotica TaxID=2126181 RepID=A0A8H6T7X8_9AGAR|nr:GATA zinc finger domain-containing protein [Mycena indigotica]KAF7311861.1 GATA zinc finger domain-containing protein [Mycena indigotica]
MTTQAYPPAQPHGYPGHSYAGGPHPASSQAYPGQPSNIMVPTGMVGYAPASHGYVPSAQPDIKACANCGATSTPLWRRDPVTYDTLCNACGLYLQQRRAQRPVALIEAEREYQDYAVPVVEDATDGVGESRPQCSHCRTRETSVWRRNKDGDQVCNACGVYQRLRGKERPLSLRRDKVKPRAKHSQT